jgi:uncharacterized membrane protein YfcA
MDNYSKIYWLTRLDSIESALAMIFTFSCIILLAYYMIYMFKSDFWDEDDKKEYKLNWGKFKTTSTWLGIITGVILIFIPNKNDMLLIYAGGKTMDYVQKDSSLSKLPYQTTAIISEYLDKSIKELKDKEAK